jgi:hypothetical protein
MKQESNKSSDFASQDDFARQVYEITTNLPTAYKKTTKLLHNFVKYASNNMSQKSTAIGHARHTAATTCKLTRTLGQIESKTQQKIRCREKIHSDESLFRLFFRAI